MQRCFIGFELSSETRRELSLAARPFRRALSADKPRFLDESAYHVTLKFLGPVADERFDPLTRALRHALLGRPTLTTTWAGFGALPKRSKAHVLVAVLSDAEKSATELQQLLEAATSELGFAPEAREFKPHATLARFHTAIDLRNDLARGTPPKSPVVLASVALFLSTLAPGGAKYSVIERFPLAGE